MIFLGKSLYFLVLFHLSWQQQNMDVDMIEKMLFKTSGDVDNRKAIEDYNNMIGMGSNEVLNHELAVKIIAPRCGKPHGIPLSSRSNFWRNRLLTYSIINTTSQVEKDIIKDLLYEISSMWVENTNLEVLEMNSSRSGIADIDLFFTRIDGPGLILGYANNPPDGDIYLDALDPWTLNIRETHKSSDLRWILTHELGHALGLNHSQDEKSVMFPYYYGAESYKITDDDLAKLISLYGQRDAGKALLCTRKSIDAMFESLDGENIMLSGQKYWKFTIEGLQSGPFELSDLVPSNNFMLPYKIHGVYRNRHAYLFFVDNKFYRYDSRQHKFKKKDSSLLGLDSKPIDDVFDDNRGNIYFFKGSEYFVLDTKKPGEKKAERTSRLISENWIGIPNNISAATRVTDDIVMFVKDNEYYLYNLETNQLEDGPLDFKKDFLECP